MDSKNQPNEVESSIFSQVGSYAIWCANYDKKVYEKSKQEVLEDIGVTQKMILDILSLLEKLGYPMGELGTYFYERLILSVCESLNEIIKEKDMEKYNELVANLNDNYSSFYLWLAREDLEIGIKSFHFYIDQAMSKIDKDKMDKELTSKVRELFKESNQNMSDIETLRLNHGKTALYLATHLLNDSKVTNISNLESFKMKKLGTFSGTKLNLKEKSECV